MVTIPDEVYREACVYTTEEAIASCQVVGYPAMIKASWGGGGKGIRKVCCMHDCSEAENCNYFLNLLITLWLISRQTYLYN